MKPSNVVTGTSSYTVPVGYNAIVNVSCSNGQAFAINGINVLISQALEYVERYKGSTDFRFIPSNSGYSDWLNVSPIMTYDNTYGPIGYSYTKSRGNNNSAGRPFPMKQGTYRGHQVFFPSNGTINSTCYWHTDAHASGNWNPNHPNTQKIIPTYCVGDEQYLYHIRRKNKSFSQEFKVLEGDTISGGRYVVALYPIE